MATHNYHGPGEDSPDSPIFHDGCPECSRQAKHPAAFLDEERMRRLWLRMVAVEKLDIHTEAYRSGNEAVAGRWCYEVAVLLERHANVDPWHPLDELTFKGPFQEVVRVRNESERSNE